MNFDASHTPRKRFGQNFLRDNNIVEKIVRAIRPTPTQTIVEIGPGQGAMTLPLLASAARIEAIELDRDLAQKLLQLKSSHPNLYVHQADALQFDFSTLTTAAHKFRLVGNLPYNISTPLLFHLLEFKDLIEDMHFMLQKEVVERLASPPRKKSYGRLSVMAQYFCDVEYLFTVAPECFYPPPKVESAIVRLVPRANITPHADNFSIFRDLINHAFQQRRKTLRNGLRQWLPQLEIEQLHLADLELDSSVRPDTIAVAQYVELSNRIAQALKR